ncbi:MAG: DUF2182 domain-containing protein [Verrucomicrobiota bacterium]
MKANDLVAAASLEEVLQRDRVIVGLGLFGVAAVSWGYMAYEARAMALTGVCECFGLKMGAADATAWGWVDLLALFLMWAEMMVAMMVPTVAPMILTFATVNRNRRQQQRPYVPTSLFLAGYLIVWTVFSAVAALVQWGLHETALLSPMMVSTSSWMGGGLLIAAGVFQWTPLKHACLRHCRSPLSFLMTDWREGLGGALRMGINHGAYCLGCCWFLMALLFVAGVMNLLWIAAITAFVLLEKISPHPTLQRISGIALVGAGLIVAAGPLLK